VVLITNSNVKHELNGSEYPDRVQQCKRAVEVIKASGSPRISALRDVCLGQLSAAMAAMDETVYSRALHVISENDRTEAAAHAIGTGNWEEVGRLMTESHLSLQKNYHVSCSELDALVNIAVPYHGVYGSRMTGGGFGGCTVTLVDRSVVSSLMTHMDIEYYKTTGKRCTFYVCEPEAGAGVLDLDGRAVCKTASAEVATSQCSSVCPAKLLDAAAGTLADTQAKHNTPSAPSDDCIVCSNWFLPAGIILAAGALVYLMKRKV
jgi:hypothetical protein